jgi:hypothetical protein
MAKNSWEFEIGSKVVLSIMGGDGQGRGEVLERSLSTSLENMYFLRYKRVRDGKTIERWWGEEYLYLQT